MTDQNRKDLVNYRINRAKETLHEVYELIKLKCYNSAVNRLYYACFYAVNALMIKHKLMTKTHDGIRQMFGLHFVKTGLVSNEYGRFFSNLYEKRQTGDYDDFIFYNKETVEDLLISAKEFINAIEKIIST